MDLEEIIVQKLTEKSGKLLLRNHARVDCWQEEF